MVDILQKFPDEQSCLNYLEQTRWQGFPVSPFDPLSKVYKCRNGNYRCKNSGKYFNVKTGTIFYNSKIPLQTWFHAISLMSAAESSWNSVSLSKELGLTQKSTWFMMQKIKRHLKIGLRKSAGTASKSDPPTPVNTLADWLKSLK